MPDANRNFALNSLAGAAFGGMRVTLLDDSSDRWIFQLPVNAAWLFQSVRLLEATTSDRVSDRWTVITVGDTHSWLPDLLERAKALKMGNGFDPKAELYAICDSLSLRRALCVNCSGPVISPQAKEKIESLIASCEEEGGKILLDGRGAKVDGYPNGNWVGPTVLEATTKMKCYQYVFLCIRLIRPDIFVTERR